MTKYKEYFMKMISENKEIFDSFAKLHLDYSLNQDGLQEKYNVEGEKIMEIVHEYEDRLCKNTENGIYNKFSGGLSEKFQGLVRAHFPLIDHVGLIIEKSEMNDSTELFSLKRIDLT